MFSQKELLLMIGIVGTLLVIISILTIIDIIEYVRGKKKVNIINDENIKVEKEELVSNKIDIVEVEDKQPNINEEIHISDMDFEEELDPLIEEIDEKEPVDNVEPIIIEEKPDEIKVQKINNNVEISAQEQLEEALNTIPNEMDAITKFEEEQERTAIISLDELKNKTDDLYNSNEIVQYDDGDEPISIEEIMNKFNKKEEVKEESDIQEEKIVKEERPIYTHKETTPFISMVYGIEKNDHSLEFENTATYEKLSTAKNKDFIARLREMNENK